MSTYNWKNGDSGNWGTAGDWQQDAVPNSTTADVTIASATNIGVTIAAGQTFAADSVTLGSSAVTLDVAGRLNLGGATDELVLNTGTLNLEPGGVIANGTIIAGAGDVRFGYGAALDDITYVGDLNFFGDLVILGGLHVENASGSGPGTINMTGGSLAFEGNQTLDNVGVNLGPTGVQGNFLGASDTLTLGRNATINSSGPGFPGGNILYGYDIVNNGVINVLTGLLTVDSGTLINSGLINVAAGSTLELDSVRKYVGVIDDAGAVVVGGDLTLADLVGITLTGSASLEIKNSLDLGGGALSLSSSGTFDIGVRSTITNGTIIADVVDADSFSSLENGITLVGELNLPGGTNYYNRDWVYVTGGLQVLNAGGSPGTIDVAGYNSQLILFTSQTLNNVMNFNGGRISAFVENYTDTVTLTLGSQNIVNASSLGGAVESATNLVNDGTINLTPDSTLGIDAGATFDNAGTIVVAYGSYLDLTGGELINTGVIIADGSLNVGESVPLAFLNQISWGSSSELEIKQTDTIDLGGGVLAVGGDDNISIYVGTVSNGTINASLGTLRMFNPRFHNITYEGDLNVANGEEVFISGSLTVENAAGNGPGTINLTGENAGLQTGREDHLEQYPIILNRKIQYDRMKLLAK